MSKNVKLLLGFLVLAVIVLVGFLAYVLGSKSLNSTQSPTVQNTPAPTASQTNNSIPTVIPNLTPTPAQIKTVEAGGVLSFPKYTVLLPEGWTSEREQGQDMDKLTLTKQGYKITISEGAFGGSGCLYPGDSPQEMAQNFTSYVEISNPNGFVFRRSSTGTSGWTVCQKGSGESFGTPTIFGHMSITAPSAPDTAVVTEIDGILTSLSKK